MLKQVRISNYKSIDDVIIDLGRINVFIGENGAGKSNVLEAIALAGAADAGKLDNEFLTTRGVRVTSPRFMRSAFTEEAGATPIKLTMIGEQGAEFTYSLTNDDKPYSTWQSSINISSAGSEDFVDKLAHILAQELGKLSEQERSKRTKDMLDAISTAVASVKAGNVESSSHVSVDFSFGESEHSLFRRLGNSVNDFIIYSPENSALRTFAREGQIEPLGINGEGLLKLLAIMSRDVEAGSIDQVRTALRMLNWFENLHVVDADGQTRMDIVDRFLNKNIGAFDQRSANEGFLFITFYFTLFLSPLTPRFFAIDNVDASLNPKLCEEMTVHLTRLAREGDKQVILTTHQPAVLDGLNLNEDEQRLFIVSRSAKGRTKVKRFMKPLPEGYPRRMSELFLSGAIGGLPKSF